MKEEAEPPARTAGSNVEAGGSRARGQPYPRQVARGETHEVSQANSQVRPGIDGSEEEG